MSLDIDTVFDEISREVEQSSREGIRRAGPVIIDGIRENFKSEGRRGNNPEWQPTSGIARLNRTNPAARADGSPTLVDQGTLRDSIAFAEIVNEGADLVGFYEPGVGYAKDMQEGTIFIDENGNEHDVPARPFMYMATEDADAVAEELAEALP